MPPEHALHPSDFGVASGYESRLDNEYFDDTGLKDEWQDSVYRIASEIVGRRGFTRVADFGCGSGFKLLKYFSNIETIGYDLPPTISHLSSRYPEKRWSSERLSSDLFDGWDLVIASDVIEHMTNPIDLLSAISSSATKVAVISTPALDILADRGQSPRLGPPNNRSHVREWSTLEFNKFVSKYIPVTRHIVTEAMQATQVVVSERG